MEEHAVNYSFISGRDLYIVRVALHRVREAHACTLAQPFQPGVNSEDEMYADPWAPSLDASR